MFLDGKNRQFFVHVYHAFHHVLTIKEPRSAHHFSQNTPQKQGKVEDFSLSVPGQIFSVKN
jgi:hypothetical protein